MQTTARILALTSAVGILVAVLAGCGGGSGNPEAASSAGSSPRSSATAVTLTAVTTAMSASVTAASGFHVKGVYTWPSARLKVDVDLLKSGQMAGSMADDSEPLSAIYTGGRMYEKLTPRFLGYFGKSGECAALCSKYVLSKPSTSRGLLRSMGITSTESIIDDMSAIGPEMTSVTFDGQPAYRWTPPNYGPNSYIIVSALPQCFPLKIYDPGHFVLTFSQWNKVSTPEPPPTAQIYTGTW